MQVRIDSFVLLSVEDPQVTMTIYGLFGQPGKDSGIAHEPGNRSWQEYICRISMQDGGVQHPEMRFIEIGGRKHIATDSRNMQQLDERDLVRVARRKAYARKAPVVETAAAGVLLQQEWMMDAVSAPERNRIVVIVENMLEDGRCCNPRVVIGIKTDEQIPGPFWRHSLVRSSTEQLIQLGARMGYVHVMGDWLL